MYDNFFLRMRFLKNVDENIAKHLTVYMSMYTRFSFVEAVIRPTTKFNSTTHSTCITA